MADEKHEETFDSTEINTDEIVKTDSEDEWEHINSSELDDVGPRYISVPIMHQDLSLCNKENVSCIQSDERTREILRNAEAYLEQLSVSQPEFESVPRETHETMQRSSSESEEMSETERVEKEIEEAMREVHPSSGKEIEKEKESIEKAGLEVPLAHQQELKKGKKSHEGMEEYIAQSGQNLDTERISREIEDAMKEEPSPRQQEQGNKMVKEETAEIIQKIESAYLKEELARQKSTDRQLLMEKTGRDLKEKLFGKSSITQDFKKEKEAQETVQEYSQHKNIVLESKLSSPTTKSVTSEQLKDVKCEFPQKLDIHNEVQSFSQQDIPEETIESDSNQEVEGHETEDTIDSLVKMCSDLLVYFYNKKQSDDENDTKSKKKKD